MRLLLLPSLLVCIQGFSLLPASSRHSLSSSPTAAWETSFSLQAASTTSSTSSSSSSPTTPTLKDAVPTPFHSLFDAIINATVLRQADESNQGHDSFRFEWGTWIESETLQHLMREMNQVRLNKGAYDQLLLVTDADTEVARRLRIAGGADWDLLLHVLPPSTTSWQGRQPTGSWSMLKVLTGVASVNALSASGDTYKVKTTRDLRGGSDGSLGSGLSTAGDDAVKYVGGPPRSYSGKYGKTVLLEVVVRPPIGNEVEEIESLGLDMEDVLSIYVAPEEEELEEQSQLVAEESTAPVGSHLGTKMGMSFQQVGGLDKQLDAIARRVLASRANPAAAKRLGVSHVRGILLSGPPGCGKTLLARELARILGAREPQIVNGPEILDKYIGEAEKKVRELFLPAEQEYKVAGDDSALHIIILDEMDAIARKRGTMTADTTGVRDSVVNQLLAKMDGVREASNVLVVGLTNRPELLDPALLRPGRLEVQLRVELPDLSGRRDILRIHTRQMRENGGLSAEAIRMLEDLGEKGMAARTEHFSGAELAGLVRSAASFALGRTIESDDDDDKEAGIVSIKDLEAALGEVRPALGKQDDVLKMRYPLGISPYSTSMERVLRDLDRFISPVESTSPRLQSMVLVGSGGGAGVTALAAYTAARASAMTSGDYDYVRFITALDLLTGAEGTGDDVRAAALVEKFNEAREMQHSLLVLDDVDQLCAGSGPDGYSNVMLATLRALLRSPPPSTTTAKAGGHSSKASKRGKTLHVIAATSRSDAACNSLHELFDETIVVPFLSNSAAVNKLLDDTFPDMKGKFDFEAMANMIVGQLGSVGCKTALRLVERAVTNPHGADALDALASILEDLAGDEVTAERLCEVI